MGSRLKNVAWRTAKIIITTLILSLTFVRAAEANPSLQLKGPSVRSQVAKILLSSFGGAVLGLSTLSFYNDPQNHLNNVALGGAAGAIFGAIYVTQLSMGPSQTLWGFERGSQDLKLKEDQNSPYGQIQILPWGSRPSLAWSYHF